MDFASLKADLPKTDSEDDNTFLQALDAAAALQLLVSFFSLPFYSH